METIQWIIGTLRLIAAVLKQIAYYQDSDKISVDIYKITNNLDRLAKRLSIIEQEMKANNVKR